MTTPIQFRGLILDDLLDLYREQSNKRNPRMEDLDQVERVLEDYTILMDLAGLQIIQDDQAGERLIGVSVPLLDESDMPSILYAPFLPEHVAPLLLLRCAVTGEQVQMVQLYDRRARTALVFDQYRPDGMPVLKPREDVDLFRRDGGKEVRVRQQARLSHVGFRPSGKVEAIRAY